VVAVENHLMLSKAHQLVDLVAELPLLLGLAHTLLATQDLVLERLTQVVAVAGTLHLLEKTYSLDVAVQVL
jgi:hypothetical protein